MPGSGAQTVPTRTPPATGSQDFPLPDADRAGVLQPDVIRRHLAHIDPGLRYDVKKRIGAYPPVRVQSDGGTVVSQAGAVLLVESVRKAVLDTAISVAKAEERSVRSAPCDIGYALLRGKMA
jgi:hypothetical protein